jgi:hypothetical protein
MKYEMGSVAMIYVPNFINIGSDIQKLMGGGGDTQSYTQHGDLISLFYFFKIRKVDKNMKTICHCLSMHFIPCFAPKLHSVNLKIMTCYLFRSILLSSEIMPHFLIKPKIIMYSIRNLV